MYIQQKTCKIHGCFPGSVKSMPSFAGHIREEHFQRFGNLQNESNLDCDCTVACVMDYVVVWVHMCICGILQLLHTSISIDVYCIYMN